MADKNAMVGRKGGRPARSDSAQLGAAILEAARKEFFARGFGAARMDAIARNAGTTKQTLYSRYGTKEALFIAVSSSFLQQKFVASTTICSGGIRDRLVSMADQILDAVLDPHLVRMLSIIISEAERFPELAQMSERDDTFPAREMLRTLLTEAAAAGEIHCPDPQAAMLMLQHMIIAHPLRIVQLGFDFSRKERRDWTRYAVDLFLQGSVRAPSPEPA